MCGRFYVDEGTAREIERVIRGTDLRMRKMHTGDIYPSQPAGILICCSREKDLPAADSVTGKTPAFELEEMHWGLHDAFAPVKAQYVKLVVNKPTQGSDSAARIYEVEVFGLEETLE